MCMCQTTDKEAVLIHGITSATLGILRQGTYTRFAALEMQAPDSVSGPLTAGLSLQTVGKTKPEKEQLLTGWAVK